MAADGWNGVAELKATVFTLVRVKLFVLSSLIKSVAFVTANNRDVFAMTSNPKAGGVNLLV